MDGGAFISYRREDAAGFAGRLCDSLERLLPTEPIFRDVDGLSPGQDFVAAIDARLRQCRACLAVIGRDWLNVRDAEGRRRLDQPDDFVRLELTAALARPEVLVIPVLVEGAAMPAAEALPQEIRGLARRQAVALRDDTWDADVARLVRSLEGAIRTERAPVMPPKLPFRVNWRVAAAVAGLVIVALAFNSLRSDDAPSATEAPIDTSVAEPAAGVAEPAPPAVTTSAGAVAPGSLAIPRISQVASKGLIYTVMSARIEPGGSSDTLHLRVALDNTSDGGVNFWDDLFRLVVDGDVIAPVSRLNVVVAARATSEGTVTFVVPAGTRRAALRITAAESTGEIPLDLSARAAAAPVPRSARAIVTSITRDARPLLTTQNLSATLTEAATRRFANTLRVDLAVRLAAVGPGAINSSELMLRLVVGDDVLAPTKFPFQLVQAGTTLRMAVEFEVPTDTSQVVLRATSGETRADLPLPLTLR
jgi:hypothetical protein